MNAGKGTTSGQGVNSIAIGNQAGVASQFAGSIALNASGVALNPAVAGLHINPIRNVTQTTVLGVNVATNEVTYYATPGGITTASTDLLYDDFMSCPLNNPTTPIGLMGIQASTTSTFLSPYTGTKISGRCGIIRLLNPLTVVNTPWDIYNSQPLSYDNLALNGVPLSLAYRNFADGTLTANVIQYVGVMGGTGILAAGPPLTFPTPNFFVTIDSAGTLNWYLDNVLQVGAPVTVPSVLTSYWTFGFQRTGVSSVNITGIIGTTVTWSNTTAPIYLRCGSYNTAAIGQSAYTYIDYVGCQVNTR